MTPTRRNPGTTQPVARVVLPLSLCPSTNVLMRLHWAKRRKMKAMVYVKMKDQIGRRKEPLPGRPTVLVTRYSSKPFDAENGPGGKLAIDCLRLDEQGLGWIRDDSVEAIDYQARWERAAPSRGQVIVEVFES